MGSGVEDHQQPALAAKLSQSVGSVAVVGSPDTGPRRSKMTASWSRGSIVVALAAFSDIAVLSGGIDANIRRRGPERYGRL